MGEFGVGHGHTTILALTVLKKGHLIGIVLPPLRVTTKNWRSAKDVYCKEILRTIFRFLAVF